jgi:hypothetical protein
MSEPSGTPAPYRVAYSGLVRNELRDLIVRARGRGLAQQVLDAAKQIDDRLRVYPQFGQPLRDLKLRPAQLWMACVPPLVVQYSVDDERRVVMVVVPIRPLPNSGLDP